jgi:hypothetical protein
VAASLAETSSTGASISCCTSAVIANPGLH